MSRPPQVDPLVHAPARLGILAALYVVEEADFLYLLHATGLTKGNLSAHLARLEKAGYVDIEKGFRGKIPLTLVRLSPAGRAAFDRYRETMLDFLQAVPGERAEP